MTVFTSAGRRRSAGLVAALAVTTLALAGCSSSGSSSGAMSEAPPGAPVADGGVTGGDSEGSGGEDTGGTPQAVVADRSIVVRADLTVEVPDLAPATDQLAGVAARYDATIASQTTSAGSGGPVEQAYGPDGLPICPPSGCPTSYASSTTTLRLENSDVDALIADLAKLGVVVSSYRTTEDVTAEVADVDARIKNAEASLVRVRALMEKATSITDVVALEAELSRRQADLEALQARQRTLADQTAQATVTVRLVTSDAPVVTEPSTGFVAGLQAGWEAFTAATVLALTIVGALLPFLLVLVPIALLVWWLVRRTTRPAGSPPAQP